MGKQLQRGQALLIVVLVMVVALTVGLSVASRSITNLKITSDDENSQRAFFAAEAGVERLIKSNCVAECVLDQTNLANNASFTGRATAIKGLNFLVKGGVLIKQNEGSDVWLSDYSTDPTKLYASPWSGTLHVYWGDVGNPCANAAIQIMVLHGSSTTPILTQYVYDPCVARRAANHFSVPDSIAPISFDSKTFANTANITIGDASKGLLMRIIPLYTNTTVGINGSTALPIQGQQIEVTGNANGTVRKVSFVQNYASIPSEFFQYVLMSSQ